MSGENLSRSAFQRTELGPIMHILAHDVYDRTEALLEPSLLPRFENAGGPGSEQIMVRRENMFELGRRLSSIATSTATLAIQGHDYEPIVNYVADSIERTKNFELTYYPNTKEVLNEGVRSGVIMPINLWQSITFGELASKNDELWSPLKQIPLDETIDKMQTTEFSNMLHFLAYGYNGSIGSISTEFHGELRDPFAHIWSRLRIGFDDAYIFDSSSNVVGFSDLFRQKWIEQFKKENSSAKNSNRSGGCPVRHSDFKSISQEAQDLIGQLPEEKQVYLEINETAILRGLRLVVSALRTVRSK